MKRPEKNVSLAFLVGVAIKGMAIDDVETSQGFFHAFVACSTALRLGSSSMLSY